MEQATQCFGEQHNIDQFALFKHIARVDVSVDVGSRANHYRELAYGIHSSAEKHAAEAWDKSSE